MNVSRILAVAAKTPGGLKLEGSCFPVASRLLATAAHVVAGSESLAVVLPNGLIETDYQDTTDLGVRMIGAEVVVVDPIRDLALIRIEVDLESPFELASTDAVAVGSAVTVFGYPHADHGRLVLTHHSAQIGARVLLDAGGIKTKHVVLNIQTRPGQSGAPAVVPGDQSVAAVVVGAYRPQSGGSGVIIGGIDPQTLHQTSHAISAEYVREMLEDVSA